MDPTLVVGDVPVYLVDGAVLFASGMAIDADGAPNAYHPPTAARPNSGRPPGLDYLANAGQPGRWWGIVTNTGRHDGEPVVQGPDDPYPGFYISKTALEDLAAPLASTRRYVDSTKFPYVSLPAQTGGAQPRSFAGTLGLMLGDVGTVVCQGKESSVVYADVGPSGKLGEGSIALAQELDIFRTVNGGHEQRNVVYCMFTKSHTLPRWPRSLADIRGEAELRFSAWGGRARMAEMFPSLAAIA